MSFIPNFQTQVDNWGFCALWCPAIGISSHYPTEALSQALFAPHPGEFHRAHRWSSSSRLLSPSCRCLIENGNLRYQQAIPTTFAVSYLDIVGAVGYGYRVDDALSLGANLKVVNRRVSTKIIDSENYEQILMREVRQRFQELERRG